MNTLYVTIFESLYTYNKKRGNIFLRRNGFTLAEVLITLVIIGIIAAMTIPSLINKTNEQETVSALKKTYSSLSQAYQKIFAENGEITPAVERRARKRQKR